MISKYSISIVSLGGRVKRGWIPDPSNLATGSQTAFIKKDRLGITYTFDEGGRKPSPVAYFTTQAPRVDSLDWRRIKREGIEYTYEEGLRVKKNPSPWLVQPPPTDTVSWLRVRRVEFSPEFEEYKRRNFLYLEQPIPPDYLQWRRVNPVAPDPIIELIARNHSIAGLYTPAPPPPPPTPRLITNYLRKYLNDPLTIEVGTAPTPAALAPVSPILSYLRRYLNDV